MRLGKPMEHLQSALKATQLQTPTVEQLMTIGRQLGYAGYLTYDALAWVSLIPHEAQTSVDSPSGNLHQVP
jgi:peroxin-11B